MAQIAIDKLAAWGNTPLNPLYVIHGEEDLLRLEALDGLRAAAKSQNYARERYTTENTADWQDVSASLNSMGLFADLKFIEIHIPNGKPSKDGIEVLQHLAEQMPEGTVAVAVLPKLERAQQQSKWFTALTKNATVAEAKAVTAAMLPEWIRKRLQTYGLNIQADALALFAERVEGNLLAAKQEIDKLALLHPQGTELQTADMQSAVANVARFDPFQLSTAWMGGDTARTLRLLEGLEADEAEPVLILWALCEDIRTLIRLHAAFKQGQSIGEVRNSLRLWGEKQYTAPQAVRRITVPQLLDALQECARIDRLIKGAEDGNVWPALQKLVLDLSAPHPTNNH